MTTPSPLPTARQRPLSPHLSIYKPQLTSSMSIFQKVTGVGLAGGLIVMLAWIVSIAMGPEAFALVNGLCKSIIGQLLFFGWIWALFYHLCNGLRFLTWSTARGLSLRDIYLYGYLALAASFLLTGGLWVLIYKEWVLSWL